MWPPHLNLALLPLHTFNHPLQNDTLTVAWTWRSFFALVLQCICLGLSLDWLSDIYDACVYLLSIELHDDCQMLWVWPKEHFGLANWIMLSIGHHMNAENAFIERIEILSTIAKKGVLVLQNLHALYCTWKAECQPHPALTYIAAFLFSFDAAFDSGHYSN